MLQSEQREQNYTGGVMPLFFFARIHVAEGRASDKETANSIKKRMEPITKRKGLYGNGRHQQGNRKMDPVSLLTSFSVFRPVNPVPKRPMQKRRHPENTVFQPKSNNADFVSKSALLGGNKRLL